MVTTVFRKMVDTDDEIFSDHPVLLPEHVLAYLVDCGMDVPDSAVLRYWQHHRDTFAPWALQHSSDGTHVPIGLYGDAAKYGDVNTKKIWGIWMNVVLFRPRSVRLSRYLLFAVDHETSLGVRTIYPLLAECVRSLNSVYDGVLGRKFCVTEIRGDWEFQYMIFRMRRFWNSSSLCWRTLLQLPPSWTFQTTLGGKALNTGHMRTFWHLSFQTPRPAVALQKVSSNMFYYFKASCMNLGFVICKLSMSHSCKVHYLT